MPTACWCWCLPIAHILNFLIWIFSSILLPPIRLFFSSLPMPISNSSGGIPIPINPRRSCIRKIFVMMFIMDGMGWDDDEMMSHFLSNF
jgi:hypothetical protein